METSHSYPDGLPAGHDPSQTETHWMVNWLSESTESPKSLPYSPITPPRSLSTDKQSKYVLDIAPAASSTSYQPAAAHRLQPGRISPQDKEAADMLVAMSQARNMTDPIPIEVPQRLSLFPKYHDGPDNAFKPENPYGTRSNTHRWPQASIPPNSFPESSNTYYVDNDYDSDTTIDRPESPNDVGRVIGPGIEENSSRNESETRWRHSTAISTRGPTKPTIRSTSFRWGQRPSRVRTQTEGREESQVGEYASPQSSPVQSLNLERQQRIIPVSELSDKRQCQGKHAATYKQPDRETGRSGGPGSDNKRRAAGNGIASEALQKQPVNSTIHRDVYNEHPAPKKKRSQLDQLQSSLNPESFEPHYDKTGGRLSRTDGGAVEYHGRRSGLGEAAM
ncbi:uncharacterized protein BCR38DRAFT_112849 [Pseudomassariella vexata]|uniref:Uncharacterized protein n=1 Tax=Pseudomassariella vexata TaxID=1141098 RepID=A0A1Y2DCE1_9PEZI|nr:uncharacterized protein BCR38DRAFT_112849 [Pseudomassariella vexata]ORY56940.1 hypothetical protein BCR38DRAFT_112849 [Pseudomassariella vexata]